MDEPRAPTRRGIEGALRRQVRREERQGPRVTRCKAKEVGRLPRLGAWPHGAMHVASRGEQNVDDVASHEARGAGDDDAGGGRRGEEGKEQKEDRAHQSAGGVFGASPHKTPIGQDRGTEISH